MAITFGTRFNVTTGDVFIPEIWSKDLTIAREAAFRMSKWVDRRTVEPGDVLHIPNLANLADPQDADADGDVANVTPTTDTKVDVNINNHKVYKLNIPDKLSLTAKYDLAEEWKKKAGYGLGLKMERDLISLWAGLSQIVGDASSDISPTRLLRAIQKLNEAEAPEDTRYCLVSPGQMTVMLDTPRFINTDSVGYSQSGSPIVTGRFGQAYGVQIAWSNQLVVDNGINNLVWHKDAFVLAMRKEVSTEKFARTQFSDQYGASVLYGFAEKRDDHGIVMKSQ